MRPSRALLLAALAASAAAPADPWRGVWIGGTDVLGGSPLFLEARIEAGRLGRMRFPLAVPSVAPRSLENFRAEGTGMHFECGSPWGHFVFDGALRENVVAGQAACGERSGRFHLRRLPEVAAPDLDAVVGTYELEPGRLVTMTWGASGCLRWSDSRPVEWKSFSAQGAGYLYPVARDDYLTSYLAAQASSVDERVQFQRDHAGRVSGIVWPLGGGKRLYGAKLAAYRQEKVRVRSGDLTLVGTLYLPPGAGPFPAVVVAPDAGGAARDDYACVSHGAWFTRNGFAFLACDKRGVGESQGSWSTSGPEELAGDVVACIRYLQRRPEVRKDRIGIWGMGEGGLIGPLAALRAMDAAFVIAVSGGGVRPREEELFRVGVQMRAALYPDSVVAEAVDLVRLKFEYAQTGQGWDAYHAAYERLHEKPWFGVTAAVASKGDSAWGYWRRMNDYDPGSTLSQLRCPFLAVFGGRDSLLPVSASVRAMEAARTKGDSASFSVRVLPEADHDMLLADRSPCPAYYDLLREWLAGASKSPR